jgi:glutaminyl-tRNA synthetase
VTCKNVVKNERGEVVELRCEYEPPVREGAAKKVEGTIQWVSAKHALEVEVRLYDRLFASEFPGENDSDYKADLNPNSLAIVRALVEPSLASAKPGERFQFERVGYFFVDPGRSKANAPVFNRTVALKDSWAKIASKAQGTKPEATARRQAKDTARESKPQTPSREIELDGAALALRDAHKLSNEEAATIAMEPALASLFESTLRAGGAARTAASLLCNDVLGELRTRKLSVAPFDGAAVAELLALLAEGTVSTKGAKDVLAAMFAGEGSPRAIVEARGMRQITDSNALAAIVDRVLAANADAVGRYRAGNANVFGALVGLAMKESGGRANPKALNELLRTKLSAP